MSRGGAPGGKRKNKIQYEQPDQDVGNESDAGSDGSGDYYSDEGGSQN